MFIFKTGLILSEFLKDALRETFLIEEGPPLTIRNGDRFITIRFEDNIAVIHRRIPDTVDSRIDLTKPGSTNEVIQRVKELLP